jgi:IS30 family transposase
LAQPYLRQIKGATRVQRQCFPEGTDLASFSQAHLNKIALRLNQHPKRPWASKAPPIDAVLQ